MSEERTEHTEDESGTVGPAPDGPAVDSPAVDSPVTAGELLRQALVDGADPRFPRWLPLPGAVLAAGWAGYEAAANGASLLGTFAWPGVAIFAATTLVAWFGWQLEID